VEPHIAPPPRRAYDGAAIPETPMSADLDLTSLDELPIDARELIAHAERSIAAIREHADRQANDLRDEADREYAAIQERTDAAIATVEQTATRELAPIVRELVESLRKMQESYARDGKLDEALAIRARVRQLRGDLLGVRTDPGNLTEFNVEDIGRVVLFEVTGRTEGSVWGTDLYTTDSRLAVAAVHSGALREGERGLVRITLFDGEGMTYVGSPRNGIMTYDYGNYPVAYQVDRV
jgi:hypothetical protein